MFYFFRITYKLLLLSLLFYCPYNLGLSQEEKMDTLPVEVEELEEIVTIGSRRLRTKVNSLAPVDVISARDIQVSGFTQTIDVLQNLLPSFTSSRSSVDDGTDYVRPATLRGLGPEHVLVLINGKRRHLSSLVHVNAQARGSVAVDLNTIPASMIGRVEVLRDGAAAQYGSDAIAGVINIVLKKSTDLTASVSYGMYLSEETKGYGASEGLVAGEKNEQFTQNHYVKDWTTTSTQKTHTDGGSFTFHLGKGFTVGKNGGMIHIAAQLRSQGRSNRAGSDPRLQYFATDQDGNLTRDYTKAVSFNPKEASFNRDNSWYGKSELLDISAFLNGSLPFQDGSELYFFGGYSFREGLGPCFFRRSLDNRTVRSIYPDGFLPTISPIITDGSFAVGYKGELGGSGWSFDLSSNLGYSGFNFRVKNTANASLAATHPLQKNIYDNGTLSFTQVTNNFDLDKEFDVGFFSPLNLAIGIEYRYEAYAISKGEEGSYLNGEQAIVGGPNAGKIANPGCQCFPGYNDNSLVNTARSNFAIYVDLESDISKRFTLGLAGRFEDYSDFGQTINGKLSLRLGVGEYLALRATASSGFRAPALAQSFYSSVSTVSVNNVLTETATFPVSSPVAKAMGAESLKAEKSFNLSLGVTFKRKALSLTIDGYFISVLDRVVLSETFTGNKDANGNNLLEAFLKTQGVNAKSGRFFTNALNTQTLGLDITATYLVNINEKSSLNIVLATNLNKTTIIDGASIATPFLLSPYTSTLLLGRQNRIRMENYTPKVSGNLSITYRIKQWSFLLRNIFYGEQVEGDDKEKYDQTLPATFTHTLEASRRFGQKGQYTFALGANNLFDVYPPKLYKGNSFNGIYSYPVSQPYGFMGRYVYIRFNLSI